MKKTPIILALLTASALAGCGKHQQKTQNQDSRATAAQQTMPAAQQSQPQKYAVDMTPGQKQREKEGDAFFSTHQ